MSDEIEDEFRDAPLDRRDDGADRPTLREPSNGRRDLGAWPAVHWRGLLIGAAISGGLVLLAVFDQLGLLLWGWFALLGLSIAWGIVRWLVSAAPREALRQLGNADERRELLQFVGQSLR